MSDVIRHRITQLDYDDDEPNQYDILGEKEVTLDDTFANVVVVDHIPIADEAKLTKLSAVLHKVFGQMGNIAENGLYVPVDENKMTKGFAFVEYTSADSAAQAVKQLQGFKLDKAHVFDVCYFDDFKKYESVPDQYVPEPTKAFVKDDDVSSWLVSPQSLAGCDQFAIRQGEVTEIAWNDFQAKRPVVEDAQAHSRVSWTESYVVWSPLGTYLTSFHKQGIQLWGGPKFTKQMRIGHQNARLVDFSPNEKYLVTFSPQYAENDDPKDPKCIIVWDVRTGQKLRGFTGTGTPQWPALHWSHDDKYFARLGEDCISVYETPGMGLLDKQSIKVAGVKDFSWCPNQNIIAYFVPEQSNIPAKVCLIQIPTRKEVRQKNLFNVKDCKLHWQQGGKYLCVKVDRLSKTKKSTFINFELFRMREKDVPTELLELKEPVHAFAWEPKGDRFAIIHGENANRPDITFYTLAGKQVQKLKTIEKRAANALFWSPAGSVILIAGLRNLNGVFEFYDVDDMETISNEEHPFCTNVDWDPSGRFVATSVSHWRHQLDTGYNIYSFSGELCYKVLRDKFFQLLWRPRPHSLLTEADLKQITKDFPAYSKRYDAESKVLLKAADRERRDARNALRSAFSEISTEREKEYSVWRQTLNKLYGRDLEAEEKEIEEIEEITEELLDEYEEIIE